MEKSWEVHFWMYSGSKNGFNVWPLWKDWPAINKIK
jgi:hypothetical protein